MSKQTVFNTVWLKLPEYKPWLKEDPTNRHGFKCTVCKKTCLLGNMGKKALAVHSNGSKHKARMSMTIKWEQKPLHDFFNSSLVKKESPSETVAPSTSVGSENPPEHEPVGTASVETNMEDLVVPPPPTDQKQHRSSQLTGYILKDSVLSAEVLWSCKTVTSHYSCASSADTDKLFQVMFPDSQIARQFKCGATKCDYLIRFGLAPFFEKRLLDKLSQPGTVYTVSFDESLNRHLQEEQMDLLLRFWDKELNRVVTRYFTSEFLGHTRSDDLLKHFRSALQRLNEASILQIAMDGPATNWKFLDQLVKEREESAPLLLNLGCCGLHVVHGAFKSGAQSTGWNIDSLLKALYYCFHDAPARREDYTEVTGSTQFPKKFASTRWLEDIPVAERGLLIWPNVTKYVRTTLAGKKSQIPKTQSFTTIRDGTEDPLIPAKLQFFITIASVLKPFLEKFQTDHPMMPFMAEELERVMRNLMMRFIKKTVLDESTSGSQLARIDIFKEDNLVNPKKIDTGYAVKAIIQELEKNKSASQLQMYQFKNDCKTFLQSILVKLMERCPLKYQLVRYLAALNPKHIASEPEEAEDKFGKLLGKLLSHRWLDASSCDEANAQYVKLVNDVKLYHKDEFKGFSPGHQPLDSFWYQMLGEKEGFELLWSIVQKMLILCHGQACIERGFSVNKSVAEVNMSKSTLIAFRKVYDALKQMECKVHDIPVSKQMLESCRHARKRYDQYLAEQKRTADATAKQNKQKLLQIELESCKKRKQQLEKSAKMLVDEADELYTEAEKKNKMLLVSKANALKRKAKEKEEEVLAAQQEIGQIEKKLKAC